jgi:hypothetical protein
MAKRTPARCKGDVYRCPALWKGASQHAPEIKVKRARAQWSQLCAAWLPFVADPTRRFFLEKDPDLAIGFVAGSTLLWLFTFAWRHHLRVYARLSYLA